MENRAKIITDLDTLFGPQIDHEIIKMILQSCNWNRNSAIEILNDMASSSTNRSQEESTEGWCNVTSSRGRKKNAKTMGEIKKKVEVRNKLLILMRGLPGSGKSTLAKKLNDNTGVIYSTDDFFYDHRKIYVFNPYMLEDAHKWNRKRTATGMRDSFTPIIIDNTNIELWEMRPYVILALQYGYKVKIIEPDTPWKFKPYELSLKNCHNISKWKIEDMLSRYDHSITLKTILPTEYRKIECPVVHTSQSEIHEPFNYPNTNQFQCSKEKRKPGNDPVKNVNYLTTSFQDKSNMTTLIKHAGKAHNSLNISNTISELENSPQNFYSLNEPTQKPEICQQDTNIFDKAVTNLWDNWSEDASIVTQPETKQRTQVKRIGNPNKWSNGINEFEEAKDSTAAEELTKAQYEHKETQSSLVGDDVDSSHVLYGHADRFMPVEGGIDALYNRGSGKIDVGCMTEQQCNHVSSIKAIDKLASTFSSCSKETLTDMLEKCQYNIDWAVDILIDSGYEMSSSFDDSIIPQDDKSRADSPLISTDGPILEHEFNHINSETSCIQSDVSFKKTADEVIKSSAMKTIPHFEDSSDMIEIYLERDSAESLIQTFGPIGPINNGTKISGEQRAIKLPIELCKLLHDCWVTTYNSNFSVDSAECDNSSKPKLHHSQASRDGYQVIKNNSPLLEDNLDPFIVEPPVSFKEIMDVEQAVVESLKVKSNDVNKLSSILSLQKLEKEFSHIDPNAVKVNLIECLYNYDKAKLQLTLMYGEKLNIIPKATLLADSEQQYQNKTEASKSSEEYRQEAVDHCHQKVDAMRLAQNYTRKKMYSVASHYSQRAATYATLARQSNHNAACLIMQNSGTNETGTDRALDVHFLHVDEAIRAIQSAISHEKKCLTLRNLKEVELSVITGYGRSSSDPPKLKPAIVKYLTSLGYAFREEPGNPGLLRVNIRL